MKNWLYNNQYTSKQLKKKQNYTQNKFIVFQFNQILISFLHREFGCTKNIFRKFWMGNKQIFLIIFFQYKYLFLQSMIIISCIITLIKIQNILQYKYYQLLFLHFFSIFILILIYIKYILFIVTKQLKYIYRNVFIIVLQQKQYKKLIIQFQEINQQIQYIFMLYMFYLLQKCNQNMIFIPFLLFYYNKNNVQFQEIN
eukprot:TRINITY_DN2804_c5_g1_i1.p3 TRINITY_DN2804_c5_g1~~TRINITY_DN2804_c5_g1_i1.p3  ORF type:complete len:206 (-),score=-9.23 TRINITY_DN2804_c5_g1_i1:611-1204(-)